MMLKTLSMCFLCLSILTISSYGDCKAEHSQYTKAITQYNASKTDNDAFYVLFRQGVYNSCLIQENTKALAKLAKTQTNILFTVEAITTTRTNDTTDSQCAQSTQNTKHTQSQEVIGTGY